MDPVTIIGLLASVTNIVHASKATARLANRFKNGEIDLRTLSRDLSLFVEALSGFERVLRSRQMTPQVSPDAIETLLSDAAATVKHLEDRLDNVSTSPSSTARRIRWVHHGASIKKSHERVKELNSMLQVFLTLAHTEAFFATASQQYKLSITAPEETDERAIGKAETSFLQVPQFKNRPIRLSDTSTGSRSRSMSDGSVLSSDSLTLLSSNSSYIIDDTASSGQALVETTASEKSEYPKRMSGETIVGSYSDLPHQPLVIRQACRYSCYCKCHEAEDLKMRRGIIKLKKSKGECTDPSCKMNRGGNQEIGTQATSSFFRKICAVISSNSIKVRYNLSTYRMVSEGSDVMRFVKHGDLGRIKASIESGEATIWDTAPDGWSLLHTAAYNRQLPIVKYLLELGVNTDSGDVGARKPADLAILKSMGEGATKTEHEIVEVFSKEDDFLADFEFTPIHVATLNMYPTTDAERPTLRQLIELVDEANNSPVSTNWTEWKTKYANRSPLYGDILEYFRASADELPKGAKIVHNLIDQQDKKYLWTPLHWASSAGRVDEMEILVHHGADPLLLSYLNSNILHAAAESKLGAGLAGALKIWERWKDQLDINQQNRWLETPLHVASWCSAACVKLLLEAGAAPDAQQQDGQVPLHCAGLSERRPERRAIAALLCQENRSDHINVQDVDGRPPLFDFLDDPEYVALLISCGARLDLVDGCGKTALHHACCHDENETLKVLLDGLKKKAVVAFKDLNGNTPLMEALSNSHIECAKYLLDFKSVGDIISTEGWAPVHYAAKIGDRDLLEAVLKHPTFMKGMKTSEGKRAETIAMENGKWSGEFKELLRRYDYFR